MDEPPQDTAGFPALAIIPVERDDDRVAIHDLADALAGAPDVAPGFRHVAVGVMRLGKLCGDVGLGRRAIRAVASCGKAGGDEMRGRGGTRGCRTKLEPQFEFRKSTKLTKLVN